MLKTVTSESIALHGEWAGDVVRASTDPLHHQGPVDSTESPEIAPLERDWLRRRQQYRAKADTISKSPKLAFALLSFIQHKGALPVDTLIEQGPRNRLFETILDLYDTELLDRDGATVSVSDSGKELLRLANLAE